MLVISIFSFSHKVFKSDLFRDCQDSWLFDQGGFYCKCSFAILLFKRLNDSIWPFPLKQTAQVLLFHDLYEFSARSDWAQVSNSNLPNFILKIHLSLSHADRQRGYCFCVVRTSICSSSYQHSPLIPFPTISFNFIPWNTTRLFTTEQSLTLSQTNLCFYVSAVQVFWKHCAKKEKLLVTSNFSFSQSVFITLLEYNVEY